MSVESLSADSWHFFSWLSQLPHSELLLIPEAATDIRTELRSQPGPPRDHHSLLTQIILTGVPAERGFLCYLPISLSRNLTSCSPEFSVWNGGNPGRPVDLTGCRPPWTVPERMWNQLVLWVFGHPWQHLNQFYFLSQPRCKTLEGRILDLGFWRQTPNPEQAGSLIITPISQVQTGLGPDCSTFIHAFNGSTWGVKCFSEWVRLCIVALCNLPKRATGRTGNGVLSVLSDLTTSPHASCLTIDKRSLPPAVSLAHIGDVCHFLCY